MVTYIIFPFLTGRSTDTFYKQEFTENLIKQSFPLFVFFFYDLGLVFRKKNICKINLNVSLINI